MERPEIEYPCPWSYRLIGVSEEDLRAAAREVVGDTAYEFTPGRTSAQGKYLSCTLALVVRDEAHRRGLFARLAAHPATRYVL